MMHLRNVGFGLASVMVLGAVATARFDEGRQKPIEAENQTNFVGSQPCAAQCAADIIADGFVNVSDLLAVINGWGFCIDCPPQICPGDANQDCFTNVSDLLAVINGWGPCPAPANDSCDSPAILNSQGQIYAFCTNYAATDGPPHSTCNFCCGDLQIHKDLWYRFNTSVFGGTYWAQIQTCGSEFDTKLAVYRFAGVGECNCANVSNATLVACNDDADVAGCTLQSRMRFALDASSCYMVRVGGYNGASGAGMIQYRGFKRGDDCFNPIDLGVVTAGTSLVASGNSVTSNEWSPGVTVAQAPCTTLPDGNDIWYKFQIGCGGNVIGSASTCDAATDYDTILTLYRGTCDGLILVDCNDDFNQSNCLINGLPRKSLVNLPNAASPGFYYLRLSGYNGATGNYRINIGLSCIN